MSMIAYLFSLTCKAKTIESLLCHYRPRPLLWGPHQLITHSRYLLNLEVGILMFCWLCFLYCHDHTSWTLILITQFAMSCMRKMMLSFFIIWLLMCWLTVSSFFIDFFKLAEYFWIIILIKFFLFLISLVIEKFY